MNIAAKILTAIVALEHLWFLVLEMFLWTRPIGMKTFGTTPEFAQASSVLAANQGLYNGFLAAGLIWALARKSDGFAVQVFFLSCVVVAGVYGGSTAKTTILFVQAAPALLALILAVLARHGVTAEGARAMPR
jgi:putative membrane protein